jgi:PadR family transcriptional regulator PadR
MSNTPDKFSQLRKGLMEFVVLKVISAHKVYVADILTRLSETDFGTAEGTLYPLLSRMRRENLVDYEWIESESGPPRKYYHLTPDGKAQLKSLEDYWHELNHTLTQLGEK